MNDSQGDFESVRFSWVHPGRDDGVARARFAALLTGLGLCATLLALGFAGSSWWRPLPSEVHPLSCREERAFCEARLPAELDLDLSPPEIRAAARARFLRQIIELAPGFSSPHPRPYGAEVYARESAKLRGEPSPVSKAERDWGRALADASVGPRSEGEWIAAILDGFELERLDPPELPEAMWADWAERTANAWAKEEELGFLRALELVRQERFFALETERAERVSAYRGASSRRSAGWAGIGLGLTTLVLLAVALWLARRARAMRPFEVGLSRHRLEVGDEVFYLSALEEREVEAVVALLGADGHLCRDVEGLREGLRVRLRGHQRGAVDPQARAALERLLQRG